MSERTYWHRFTSQIAKLVDLDENNVKRHIENCHEARRESEERSRYGLLKAQKHDCDPVYGLVNVLDLMFVQMSREHKRDVNSRHLHALGMLSQRFQQRRETSNPLLQDFLIVIAREFPVHARKTTPSASAESVVAAAL